MKANVDVKMGDAFYRFEFDEKDEMDFFIIDGFKIDPLLRSADRDRHLATRIHTGMGKGNPLSDGGGFEPFPVDDASQEQLFVADEFFLHQNVQELFHGLDFCFTFQVEDKLGGLQKLRKITNPLKTFDLHF